MARTKTIAWIGAWASSIGITAIGTRFLLTPTSAAAGYGVETSDPADPYLAVKGVRDIGTGLVGLALLATGQRRAVAWTMLAAAVIPAGDALLVRTHGGSSAIAYGVHGTTAATMLTCGAILLRRASTTTEP